MSRSASAALGPGVALGVYPERFDEPGGALDRAWASGLNSLTRRGRPGGARLNRFVSLVKEEGGRLDAAGAASFDEQVKALRYQLKREGQTEPLTARAFALVREAAGRTLGMRHFDVQLFGGWVMANGMLAEMETGQGKTLTATLPAGTAALAGVPAHVITANDYLVSRDAELMRPVYEALGLSVGKIVEGMPPEARRAAYRCDITYCTGKELVFDYLKDRMVLDNRRSQLSLSLQKLQDRGGLLERLLLRGLCFAVVDEADSILIDEARTPMILSRPSQRPPQEEVINQALATADTLEPNRDFSVRAKEREVVLTERGKARLAKIGEQLGGLWAGARRREELVHQAISARFLFERDRHYLVRDGKVQIIDENTGRLMPDRSWERGLHQMVEAKEGCELTPPNETLARMSYQRFFRRYLKLSGMTGTATEVNRELWSVYKLNVVKVPTNRPVQREMRGDRVFTNGPAKWAAVTETIRTLHAQRRPVLVGTCSVAASEHLSGLLDAAGLPHRVLNARQDEHEAEIIAHAGEPAQITVATNMAGRGTDIGLAAGVVELGGLHVIATERNEAGRIDRQLYGRCGRQGDPGSCESLLALDDPLMAAYHNALVIRVVAMLVPRDRPLAAWLGRRLATAAQRSTERHHARLRQDLLRMDEHLGDLLAFTGHLE